MADSDKVKPKDLYDLMWKCRDLEIDNLWKRSTLLATFLVIFWTGLGYSFYKFIDLRLGGEFKLETGLGNFFLLGIQIYAMLGSFISLLWICMTKGSKAWVEFFEGHIGCIKFKKNREMFFSEELVERLENKEYIPYNGSYPQKFQHGWSNSILSTSGGAFSPSRINVVIGIVSFMLFSLLELIMFGIVLREAVSSLVLKISFIVLFAYLVLNCLIYVSVRSKFLNSLKKNTGF